VDSVIIHSAPVHADSISADDEIWVARKDQQPAQQLTHNTWEWDHHPTWSPDGRQIVFGSNRTGKQQLRIMNADGSEQRPLSDGTFEAWDPIWVK
jgi:Tol biopolymer transport system component